MIELFSEAVGPSKVPLVLADMYELIEEVKDAKIKEFTDVLGVEFKRDKLVANEIRATIHEPAVFSSNLVRQVNKLQPEE